MRVLNRVMIFTLMFGTMPLAFARTSVDEKDAWANRQAKQLTEKCSELSAKNWLKVYLEVEQTAIRRLKNESTESLARLPDDSVFLEFLESNFPQDLLDLLPTAGTFLDCIDEFSAFKHAAAPKSFRTRARAWSECLQSQPSPMQAQTDLALCLSKLK